MKILNPVKEVPLDSGKVEVRQLPFLKAIEFLKLISGLGAKLFDTQGNFLLVKKIDGAPKLDVEALNSVVAESGDLASFLILNSTGKDQAWAEKLSLAEGLTVLKAALEQNLDPQILDLGKEVAGVVAALRKTPAKK